MASGRIEANDIFDVQGIIDAASNISNALAGINNLVKGEAGKLKVEISSTTDLQKLSEMAKQIDALADVHKRAAAFADAHATAVTELAATLNGATKPATGANQALRQLGLSLQQLDKIANTTNRQSIVSLAQNLQTLTKDIKANEAAIISEMEKIDASKMTYNELSATLSVLKEAVKGVSTAELEESAAGQKMTSVAKSLNDQLAATDAKMGGYKRNVGNYASAFDGLGFSIRQVVRETPSLGIGFNQYFLAISNNIPMLIDEWRRYGQTMKDTNKKIEEGIIQGQKMESTWKHALRSVLSWQTAVIAVLTILSSKDLQEKVVGVFNSIIGKAEELRDLFKSIGEEIGNILRGGVLEKNKDIAELDLILRKLREDENYKVGTKAHKDAIARANEIMKSNIALTASYETLNKAVDAYKKEQYGRGKSSASVEIAAQKREVEELLNKAQGEFDVMKILGLAGKSAFDDEGKKTKEYEELIDLLEKRNTRQKEYIELRKRINHLEELKSDPNQKTNLDYINNTLGSLYSQLEKVEKKMNNAKTAWTNRVTGLFGNSWYGEDAYENYYPYLQEQEKGRAKRQKEEKASYEDLWHKMMEGRYKIVSDEYQREARQRADAYQLEVYDTRKLYKEKESDLKEYYRVQLGLSKDDKTWEAQVENNKEYQKKLVELRYQLKSILESNEQEFYRNMDAMNKEYVESVISGYKKELDAFNAAEDAKVKSARRHITRRNKTLADNYNRNNSIMNAAAASQAKIDALEAKRLDAIEEKGKKQHEIYLQQREALKAIEEEEREVQKEYDKLVSEIGMNAALQSLTWFRLSAIRAQKIAVTGEFDNLRKQMDEAFEGINEGIKKNIEAEKGNLASVISELDLTKEFEKKGYDQRIVEVIFGLKSAGGQKKYIIHYYEKLAKKVAEATGQELETVMAAYARQLNAKYGTNITVEGGKMEAGDDAADKFSAMWGDVFNDRFWDDFTKYKDALSDMASTTWGYVNEMIDAWVELYEKKAEAAKSATEEAKSEYEKERALMEAGYANEMETTWQAYQEKKELQEKAEREAKHAQEVQKQIDTATQISSLITAIAKIFETSSVIPAPLGTAIAFAASTAMIAAFIRTKTLANQAAKYGEGDVQVVGGGTHASGKDTLLGYSHKGREMRVERGEVVGIIPARHVRRYGQNNVVSLMESLRNGTYEDMARGAIQRNYNIGIMPTERGNTISLLEVENRLSSIDRKVGMSTYTENDGTIVTIVGNNVVRTIRRV